MGRDIITDVNITRVQYPTYSFCVDHNGRAVQGMNCLRPLGHYSRGIESRSRHGCLCAFVLCLCCCACRYRPYDGLVPLPSSSIGLGKWFKCIHGPANVCRATERMFSVTFMDFDIITWEIFSGFNPCNNNAQTCKNCNDVSTFLNFFL
jgi:hypothetical protein